MGIPKNGPLSVVILALDQKRFKETNQNTGSAIASTSVLFNLKFKTYAVLLMVEKAVLNTGRG